MTAIADVIRSFGERMRDVRRHLAQAEKLRYRHQKESWTLGAVDVYVVAVERLRDDLAASDLGSRGLRAFRDHVIAYTASQAFRELVADTARLKDDLALVRYSLLIDGDRVTVRRYEDEADYAAEVTRTFEKFRRAVVKDYHVAYRDDPEMDHVEAGILDRVALLFPDVFSQLDDYCERRGDFQDPVIAAFDREIRLYIAYLEHVDRLRSAGLPFCYPAVSDSAKAVSARATFDLALAGRLVPQGSPVVTNDLQLRGRERIVVVTGPNQGGKTTLARTFGQLHHLARLGLPVPGSDVTLFLADRILTHFEREERLGDLRGRLQDDLIRIRDILEVATPRSVVIMNEIFTSTTLEDALLLSTAVMGRIVELDLLCVWVTFVDELASFGDTTVSMTSTVLPEDPAVRTFKVVRRPTVGRAYAEALAAKYGLSYERLKERLALRVKRESVPAA